MNNVFITDILSDVLKNIIEDEVTPPPSIENFRVTTNDDQRITTNNDTRIIAG